MTLDEGIQETADLVGIQATPSRMAEIEPVLQREIESIEVFQDAHDAIALPREHSISEVKYAVLNDLNCLADHTVAICHSFA
ncbi:hypothetical protein D3C77_438720 [compost metagenome]